MSEALDSGRVGVWKGAHILTQFSLAVQGGSSENVIVKTRIQTALDKKLKTKTDWFGSERFQVHCSFLRWAR